MRLKAVHWIGQSRSLPPSATTTVCPAAGPPLSAAPISQTSSSGRLPFALDPFPPYEASHDTCGQSACVGKLRQGCAGHESITVFPNATSSPAVDAHCRLVSSRTLNLYCRYSGRMLSVHPPCSCPSPSSGKQHPQKKPRPEPPSKREQNGSVLFRLFFAELSWWTASREKSSPRRSGQKDFANKSIAW